ncbi:MAG: winged helix-turn-helix transcriptional regulator [Methanomicrobiales archaeon]|nr:winged helix-turn-helix transcriptional regulator [Methanomicrobiales archaeon]
MRKDEIETRIVRIEKTLRDLQAGQRDISETIVTELRSFQSLLIEEKIEAMRQQLGQGYQRLLLDLVLSDAKREFERVCPDPCNVYDRKECIDITLNRLREFGERLDPESTDQFIEDQVRKDREMADRYLRNSRQCKDCLEVFSVERDRMIHAIQDLSAIRRSLKRKNQDILISELPDELVLSSIIEPLANPVRFSMMKALSNGSMSYSELSTLTGRKGGHLLFHITSLTGAGLVIKSASSGLYTLTEKGMSVMTMIRNLYRS